MRVLFFIRYLLIPFVIVILTACAANQELRKSNLGKHERFVEMPPEMDYIKVEKTAASKVNNLLSVQITLLNISNQNTGVSYRFRWLDANGMQVGEDESWKTQPIGVAQFQVIKGVAMKQEASSFLLEIK